MPVHPAPTPQRIFLGWDRPVLPAAAAHLVGHYTRGSEADMRSATLVLPGRRARRRMVELLVSEAEACGTTLVPPTSTTVGGLPALLHAPADPLIDPLLARRAWSRALRNTSASSLAEVFPDLPAPTALGEWDELGRMMADLHQSLAREGHRFSDVARICRSGGGFDDGPRWEGLAQVQRRYLRLVRDAGLADPHDSRMTAPESALPSFEGEVWLISVVDLPLVTRRLLEAASARVHALVHAPEPSGDEDPPPFDAMGIPTDTFWERAPIRIPEAKLHIVERPVNQADACLAALEAEEGRTTTDDVVVMVHPESEVLPYLEQRLQARGVRARYAAGTRLTDTAPVRLLQAVADYLDGRTFAALADLLRHPDAGTLLDASGIDVTEGSAIDAADAYFGDHLPFAMDGPLPTARRAAAKLPVVVRALERVGPLRRLTGRMKLSAWMAPILELLLDAYGTLDVDRSRPEHRRLVEVLQSIHGVAATLAEAPAVLDEECSGAEAIRAVVTGVRDIGIPPDPDRDAVELLEWLEVPLDDAPVVVLTGFNEGFLPESVTGDPFLPDSLRTRLGLADNRRRLARDAYRLTTALHSKPSVHVIAGRRTATGDPLRPSRLLFRDPGEDVAARVLRYLGADVALPSGFALADLGLRPGDASAFAVPPEPIIQLEPGEIPDRLAVTAFRGLLKDPYRFVLETVWRLDATDDTSRELDGLGFGGLAHEVLQRFGEMAMATPPTVDITSAEEMTALLMDLLREAVERRFGPKPLPAVHLQASQLERRFRAFAHRQAAWALDGWRIVAVERVTHGEGAPFDVDGVPFLLRGRIDRIDHNASTGRWAILDYKTGSSAETPEKSHRQGPAADRRWIDLQLPLYRHLLPHVFDADGGPVVPADAVGLGLVDLGYIALPQNLEECDFLLAGWTQAELEGAADAARDAIRHLRCGRFVFDPSVTRPSWGRDDPLRPLLSVGWQAAPDGDDGGVGSPGAEDDA